MSDLIDRRAVLNILEQEWTAAGALDRVKELPSAQPERKTGRWILKPNIYGVAYCSECDYALYGNNTNYCPNCGARMDNDGE